MQPTEQATTPAAEWVAIDHLVGWDNNPRKNDPAVAAVAKSIEAFGFGSPIIARRANNEVIAGHTRLKAAKSLNLATVPVRFMDLNEDDAHLLAIADNATSEIAKWDDGLLASVLTDLKERVDISQTGLSEETIQKLIGDKTLLLNPVSDATTAEPGDFLAFRKKKVPMAEDTANLLEKKLDEYLEANGSMFGFVESVFGV